MRRPGLTKTVPESAFSRPRTMRSSVVLPAPFGPITVTISPRCSDRETSESARRRPKERLTSDSRTQRSPFFMVGLITSALPPVQWQGHAIITSKLAARGDPVGGAGPPRNGRAAAGGRQHQADPFADCRRDGGCRRAGADRPRRRLAAYLYAAAVGRAQARDGADRLLGRAEHGKLPGQAARRARRPRGTGRTRSRGGSDRTAGARSSSTRSAWPASASSGLA